jgi:adenylate kinase family enzyme
MKTPIVLIGPMATGKTTLARLLAQKLGIVHYELDDMRWAYYNEAGYDQEVAEKIRVEEGFSSLNRYWKQFEIHAVERVLSDCPGGVISFGAGHSVYEDESLFVRAQRALAPYENVILILPCPNLEEAGKICKQRYIEQDQQDGIETPQEELAMIEQFVKHPSNQLLAKRVIYTNGNSPEQTCEEIIQFLGV